MEELSWANIGKMAERCEFSPHFMSEGRCRSLAQAWPLPVFERIGACGEKFLKFVHLFSATFHDAGGQLVGCLYDRYQRV